MPRKTKPPPDNPEQFKRFIDMARQVEADESPDAIDRAFDKVIRSPTPRPGQAGNALGSRKTRGRSR
jgi:hypothetical protein